MQPQLGLLATGEGRVDPDPRVDGQGALTVDQPERAARPDGDRREVVHATPSRSYGPVGVDPRTGRHHEAGPPIDRTQALGQGVGQVHPCTSARGVGDHPSQARIGVDDQHRVHLALDLHPAG